MTSNYTPGQKVDLIILAETELGFRVKINGTDQGLIYHNEIFEALDPDQEVPGYIKKVRPDGGIDVLLQNFGSLGSDELGAQIIETLKEHKGYVPVNAKSPAEQIYDLFGVSRKKFKMALGALYKKRLVEFTDEGTKLNDK